ncbi:MAG: GNAT family N-acetyltransferase [Flavobacteriales bacterium]|nr:GNAT family N-acetyltransferase [Flavobacteriales bacterium]MCB9448631.1 GNAT family N-acetyltransferase [Flavobacteriales bacterium]
MLESFETDRLILSPTSEADADFLIELMNMPKWIQYIGDRNVHTLEDALAYIRAKVTPQQERLGYGSFTVIRKEDQAKIGSCGLYDREGIEGLDIGFAFLTQFEKMGYAFEGVAKLKQVAVEQLGIRKLSAITLEENTASRKLLERIGLTFIKTVRIPNDTEELMLYEWEMTASE